MQVNVNIDSDTEGFFGEQNEFVVSVLKKNFDSVGLLPFETSIRIESVEATWMEILDKIIQGLEQHYEYEFDLQKLLDYREGK
jgi:hypothetical protein